MSLPAAFSPVLLAAFVLFGLYLLVGAVLWYSGRRGDLTPGQFRRRMAAGVVLEIDLLLWLLEGPLMRGRPLDERLLYLLAATLLLLVPMILAVREAAFILRQYAAWRRELVRDLSQEAKRGRRGPSPNGGCR